jgi:hypothetical protein
MIMLVMVFELLSVSSLIKTGQCPNQKTEINELLLTFVMSCFIMPLSSFCKCFIGLKEDKFKKNRNKTTSDYQGYKLLWNHTDQLWVVVVETNPKLRADTEKGMKTCSPRRRWRYIVGSQNHEKGKRTFLALRCFHLLPPFYFLVFT